MLYISNFFCRRMRVISAVLITILAYEPFRRATFSLFTGKKWTTELMRFYETKTLQVYSIPNFELIM
ncbi:hypothetical protein X798_07479, partial [Onchocerca flexuosa]